MAGKAIPKHTIGMCTASESACIWRASSRSAAASTASEATLAHPMKIARVEILGYELRYAHGAYVMSGGRSVTSLPSTVVRIETDAGLVGHGETCPLGATYLPAHAGGARAALAELAPALLGV